MRQEKAPEAVVPLETVHTLKSTHLHNERLIWVREPALSRDARNVTVFLDGEIYRDHVEAVPVIESLLSQGEIADSWLVFVSMESAESRWKECPCYVPFAQFIVDELLSWLGWKHPEICAAERRTLVGLSYTGLAAAFIAKECHGVFQKVISQSGSFWSNGSWLVEQFKDAPQRIPTDFYLDVGTRETQENVRHREGVFQGVSQLAAVRKFRDVLIQNGHSVKYVEFDGGHDFLAWKKALPDALKWALPNKAP